MGPGKQRDARSGASLESSILTTATLCLLTTGAIMVYSASSAESLLNGSGDPSYYLKRYGALAILGLIAMRFASRVPLKAIRDATPLLLAAGFGLTLALMVPGVGVTVNGATRWLGAGPLQFQPSEVLKIALVLYAVRVLAQRPSRVRSLGGLIKPLGLVVGAAFLLLLKQPDMGTALVICAAIGALLVAAGTPMRLLGVIGGAGAALVTVFAVVEPYRRERLTAFLDPWSDAGDTGFQAVQAMIAIGSGGLFGVGLGESVQKIFYLPEAHTDMILAIIGEELGIAGIVGVATLYAMIGFAGLRAARLAPDLYAKLLAAGLTCLVLCQAALNFFAVMGLAPLTGVPLPFISYGNSNLVVLLAGMGLLLNVASGGSLGARAAERPPLRAISGGRRGESGDRGRGHGGSRGAGPGRRRRAAS